jgi:hypothetical protein
MSVENLDSTCGEIQRARKFIGRQDFHLNGVAADVRAPKTSTCKPSARPQRAATAVPVTVYQQVTYGSLTGY